MQGFIILTDMGMLIPDGLLIREINIFYGHPERFIREALLRIKGRIYLFRYGYGHLITGWVTLRGRTILFPRDQQQRSYDLKTGGWHEKCLGPDGKMKKNAWVGQYYVGEDGVRVKDAWVDDVLPWLLMERK